MWEDPIVAEVHRTREMLAAKFNFDIDAIFADMRKRQASLGDRLVPQKKRAEPTAEADRSRHSGPAAPASSEAAPAA
jgi:phage terminase large subunit-like protein